jgi:uncharacterized protein (UPF0303 family)
MVRKKMKVVRLYYGHSTNYVVLRMAKMTENLATQEERGISSLVLPKDSQHNLG